MDAGWVEARRKPRFTLRSPLTALFGSAPARLVDISGSGALVEETEKPHSAQVLELAFESPVSHTRIALLARVVWSRLERSGDPGSLVYHAGVEFLDRQGEAEHLIAELVRARLAYPKDSLFDNATVDQQEQLSKIRKAVNFFKENPGEVRKWADYVVTAHVADHLPDRDHVFAVWEYLDRKVDLELVKKYFHSPRQ